MIRNQKRDREVPRVQHGQASVVRLEDEMRGGDPGGGQSAGAQLPLEKRPVSRTPPLTETPYLEVLLQLHPLAMPVEQLVHVAQEVNGRHDARHHQADHQEREYYRPPVVALVPVVR